MPTFKTINPATEELIAEYSYATQDEISMQVDHTYAAWKQWKSISFEFRAERFTKLAELLNSRKEPLGKLITTEMGKPLKQAINEIEKCAWICQFYAENASGYLQNEVIKSDAQKSYVHYEPLGIVLAVMPWNFPFWQVFRFAAPGLMAGNAALLKHSSNTPACGLKIQELFKEAGFPEHLFATLLINSDELEATLSHPKIAAVTLTGSTQAGRSIGSLAGKYLKKSVLELGGSDPYLILDDADLDLAAQACVSGRLINTGQSCIAAKRFIVTQKNVLSFTEKVKTLLSTKQTGNPLLGQTDLGPMARKDLRDELHDQVLKTIEGGAKCELGGEIPSQQKGYFYPATLLTNVKAGTPAYEEELFGPVAAIIEAKDDKEAIAIANNTTFGLGAAVFSQDHEKARLIAEEEIEAGCCFINDFVKSDPRLPFGGIKDSGYGRELSAHGIKEFVNIKTIYIK